MNALILVAGALVGVLSAGLVFSKHCDRDLVPALGVLAGLFWPIVLAAGALYLIARAVIALGGSFEALAGAVLDAWAEDAARVWQVVSRWVRLVRASRVKLPRAKVHRRGAAIARGDARLIGLASANPDALDEIGRLIDAGIRRRAWLRVLNAKLAGSAVAEAVAGELYQRAVREHPRRKRDSLIHTLCDPHATPAPEGVAENSHVPPASGRTPRG